MNKKTINVIIAIMEYYQIKMFYNKKNINKMFLINLQYFNFSKVSQNM